MNYTEDNWITSIRHYWFSYNWPISNSNYGHKIETHKITYHFRLLIFTHPIYENS